MRIAIAKSAAVMRHKQLSYASLAACVGGPPGPILPGLDQNCSKWSGVYVANQIWAGTILVRSDQFWMLKNGPAGLNLVD